MRLELLSEAMVDKTVIYMTRDKDTFKQLFKAYVKETGRLHCTKADGMRTMVLNELVEFDAPSFREWYYSLWPKVEKPIPAPYPKACVSPWNAIMCCSLMATRRT